MTAVKVKTATGWQDLSVAVSGLAPRVTGLPVGAPDGTEVVYVADAAAGVLWRLRYNAGSASAYKWEFVGGGWLRNTADASVSVGGSTLYSALAGGPQVTIPLAGEYDVDWGAGGGYYHTAAAGTSFYMGLDAAGLTANDADAIQNAVDVANTGMQSMRRRALRTLTAGTLVAKYRIPSGTALFQGRYVYVQPVRVG